MNWNKIANKGLHYRSGYLEFKWAQIRMNIFRQLLTIRTQSK